MRMILNAIVLIAFLATAWIETPAVSPSIETVQSKSELRKTLGEKQAALDASDADGLYDLALWAKKKGLTTESKRLLRKVIKIAPDHGKARKTLGYVLYEDEWIKERDLAKIKRKKEEAANAEKGMVKVGGEWVKKEDLALAKRGVVKVKGVWWRLEDSKKLKKGYALHPETGTWIREKDLEKAAKGLFQVNGKWVPLEKADTYHKGWSSPWVLQTRDVTLVTDYDLKKAKEIMGEAETAMVYVTKLLWDPRLPLPRRVLLRVYSKAPDYREYSSQTDETGFSAFGCFAAVGDPQHPIGVIYGEPSWGPYYLRHAAGMGTSLVLLGSADTNVINWIHTGFGSYVERYSNLAHSKHFGRQFESKGGIKNLSRFWTGFRISSDDDQDTLAWNIYQAGYLIRYLSLTKDKRLTLRLDGLREAILSNKAKDKTKALKELERAIQGAQSDVSSSLSDLLKS